MHTNLLFACSSAALLLSGFVSQLPAASTETGMALVACETTGYGDWPIGQIRRIDIQNGIVINTTGVLGTGTGHHMRFNPRGDQYAYLVGTTGKVQICNLDGGSIRSFTVSSSTDYAGYLSWTNSGIWVSGDGLKLYDTLGVFKKDYTGQGVVGYRLYVSQNDKTGSCVDESSWLPTIFSMNRGTTILLSVPAGAAEGGCSVCPSPDGTLITNNLVQNSAGPGGALIDWHKSMRIMDTLGNMVQYLLLQNATKFPANGYRWNTQAWSSNSNDWILIPVGEDNGTWVPDANLSACIYNIRSQEKICLKDNSGTSQWWMIYDYYSGKIPGSTAPSLQLSANTIDFSADQGGNNPLAKTIIASTASGSLSGVTVTGQKSWITTSLSTTSGVSMTITNTVTIAGLSAGTYRDTLTVSATVGGSKTYIVNLTITQPAGQSTFTTLQVTPLVFTLAMGDSLSFLATPRNQAGVIMKGAATAWSTSGGGRISSQGVYKAGNTAGGAYAVIAATTIGSITIRDTAHVDISTASAIHRKIDCGDPAVTALGWESGATLTNGGTNRTFAATVAIAGVGGAAPANIYKSVRAGNAHLYTVRGLVPGDYTVRIHFADDQDSTIVQRAMSYTIAGQNVLNNFSIVRQAGGINKAIALDFQVAVQATDTMLIQCAAANGSDVFEGGIEILQNKSTAITLLSPNGGETFTAGTMMTIRWYADTLRVTNLIFELSVNGSLFGIFGDSSVRYIDHPTTWGTLALKIPDSILIANTMCSTASQTCKFRISPYFLTPGVVGSKSQAVFTIQKSSAVAHMLRTNLRGTDMRLEKSTAGYSLRTYAPDRYSVTVFALNGTRLYSAQGKNDGLWLLPDVFSGTAIVKIDSKAGVQHQRFTLCR